MIYILYIVYILCMKGWLCMSVVSYIGLHLDTDTRRMLTKGTISCVYVFIWAGFMCRER